MPTATEIATRDKGWVGHPPGDSMVCASALGGCDQSFVLRADKLNAYRYQLDSRFVDFDSDPFVYVHVMCARRPVGFTGTRNGMTAKQAEAVIELLSHFTPSEFHEGDCKGADAEAWRLALAVRSEPDMLWFPIHSHPPIKEKHRAFLGGDVEHDPKDYLSRDVDIAKASVVMIATPSEYTEQTRSGTWYTIRQGRIHCATRRIVYPDGSIDFDGTE